MSFLEPSFKDITMETQYMKAHVKLSVFGWRFKRAQQWLDREIVKRMTPFVPKKTGAFLGKLTNENASRAGTGRIITSVPPQGRELYTGVSESGKPYNWTNPSTQPYWGKYTVQTYRGELNKGVKQILIGRDENG